MSLMPRYCPKCGVAMRSGEHHFFARGCPPRSSFDDITQLISQAQPTPRHVPTNEERAAQYEKSLAEMVERAYRRGPTLGGRIILRVFITGGRVAKWIAKVANEALEKKRPG